MPAKIATASGWGIGRCMSQFLLQTGPWTWGVWEEIGKTCAKP